MGGVRKRLITQKLIEISEFPDKTNRNILYFDRPTYLSNNIQAFDTIAAKRISPQRKIDKEIKLKRINITRFGMIWKPIGGWEWELAIKLKRINIIQFGMILKPIDSWEWELSIEPSSFLNNFPPWYQTRDLMFDLKNAWCEYLLSENESGVGRRLIQTDKYARIWRHVFYHIERFYQREERAIMISSIMPGVGGRMNQNGIVCDGFGVDEQLTPIPLQTRRLIHHSPDQSFSGLSNCRYQTLEIPTSKKYMKK